MYATLALSSFLLAAPAAWAQSTGSGSCTDVHIFIARGWNEQYPGRQGKLVDAICADLPGMSCDYEDIAYDAMSTDYCPSVAAGSIIALRQIQAYYAKCPSTAIVLSGYSEGATVMGDVLAGDANVYGGCADFTGLSQTSGASCNIAAAMIFGDPKHAANQSYNYVPAGGSAGQADPHTAAQLAILDYYSPRLRSYCNLDDLICAKGLGANTVEAHTNYFELYTDNAAAWAAGLVKSFRKGMYCPVSTTSSSSSATASVSTSSGRSNSTVPTSSVAITTVTQMTSVYTTVCPQTSIVTSGNRTSTSIWTGVSTATSIYSSSVTTTVSGNFVPSVSPKPPTSIITIGGKPAVVSYSTSVSTTTYANFPTLSITKVTPVATSFSNGTVVSANGNGKPAVSGTGAGAPAKPTSSPIVPYTGSASTLSAAGWLAGAVIVAGMMLM